MRRPLPRSRHCVGIAWALAGMLALASPALAATPVTIGGPFTLTAPDGERVTEQTYRGKWLLVFFGFTFCPNTCPTTLLEIAGALERLGGAADKLQVLFITVDPRRDTRETIKAYTESFDARIVGLTGTAEEIAAVTHEYGVYAIPHRTGPGEEDYTIDHSSYVYVMDPQGKFVRGFDAATPAERLANAVRPLLAAE